MKIDLVEIKNFRKLMSCRIEFSDETTVFVGANNSGKTSAMLALIKFLKRRNILLDDFTISNISQIQQLGKSYVDEENPHIPSIEDWSGLCPFLDVWLNVKSDELRYVANIIPTLSWREGRIGVRLIYEPENVETLYKAYIDAFELAKERSNKKVKLWPTSFADFLETKISSYFKINAYILDESKLVSPSDNNIANPQETPYHTSPLNFDPFKHLIRIDTISAQRWLDDSNSDQSEKAKDSSLLSQQLRDYYDRQLDPERKPSKSDISALKEVQKAKDVFDAQITKQFQSAMDELSTFGYPGKTNPKISIESRIKTSDILSHSTLVKYPIFNDGTEDYKLSENYNGLGYQNLISMSFRLMSFRDSWINGDRRKPDDEATEMICPIHLVLIEEPEAHLHVQVQQVFIKNAYKILRNNSLFRGNSPYTTQMVVSTHSSTIALESSFVNLRYFRRTKSESGLPVSNVVNLSDVFGISNPTTRFVKRYLKTTHCDLFFADAAILIEGAAERIFMPYFIKRYEQLDESYISVLEIGGRYAHYFKPLIDVLGITCLIITDLDCSYKNGNNKTASIQPQRGQGYYSSNPTIKNWVINNNDLDYLLDLSFEEKEEVNPNIPDAKTRVAYQTPVTVKLSDDIDYEFIPTTFEDSLAYNNFEAFKIMRKKGLIKKIKNAFNETDATEIAKKTFEAISDKNAGKTEFALDLLFSKDPEDIDTPNYIDEGLNWLQEELKSKDSSDFLEEEV